MQRETLHSQSYATFFCHFAVLSVPAVLLRKLPNRELRTASSFMVDSNIHAVIDLIQLDLTSVNG